MVRGFGWVACVAGLLGGAAARGQAGAVSGTVVASPDPAPYDNGFSLTLTLTGRQGGPIPDGSVTFSVGSTVVATAVAVVNGSAVYSPTSTQVAALSVGTYTLTGAYSGDANYSAATLVGSVMITQVGTTTTLVGVTPTIFYGETIADTATEDTIGDNGEEPDAGTIDFLINGAVTCVLTYPLPPGTTQSCGPQGTGEGYSAGEYMVQSVYSGDANYAASSSTVYPVTINPDPTSTTTGSSLNPSILGQSVTFTSSILDVYTTGQGTVSFFDGGTQIGSGTANKQGQATFSTSSLAVGSHTITSCLVASLNFSASTPCGAVTQTVNAPPSPFTLTVNPTAISVGVGNVVTVQVTVTPLGGFSEPVQLGCSGLPNETSCTFAQSLIGVGGGATALMVSPAAPHNCGSTTPDFVAPNAREGVAGLLLGGLALFGMRRRWTKALALLLALGVLPWLVGCSGKCKDFGTEPTSYTFTVTGSSTGTPVVSHAVTVTMNVHL